MQHNPDPLAEVPDDHGRAPIRFTKETGRGVKRNFDQAKYKAVTAAKAVARYEPFNELHRVDAHISKCIRTVIAPRYHTLTKNDLGFFLLDDLPRIAPQPEDTRADAYQHLIEVMLDDYHRYYRGIQNKTREKIRGEMTHFEQQFFRHTKPRDEGLTPRDRLQWYVDTEESAQILKKIANGTRVAGFRSKLLSHYQDLLRSHGNAAADITPDEIEALSREPYFYLMAIASGKAGLLCDRMDLLKYDDLLRPNIEALVIHVWLVYLWDMDPHNPKTWSQDTFRNICHAVDLDRNLIYQPRNDNETLFKNILSRCRPFLGFLQNEGRNDAEADHDGAESGDENGEPPRIVRRYV